MTNPIQHCATDQLHRPVRVFVVDDHESYRSLVAEVVAATEGFDVLGSAASWADASTQFEERDPLPDLVFMDVNLGEDSGVDAAREVQQRWPRIKVILISTLAQADLPLDAVTSAAGFLPKSKLSPAQICQAWLGTYDWN